MRAKNTFGESPANGSSPLLNSRDYHRVSLPVLEEVLLCKVTAQIAAGVPCRGMRNWVGPTSSRTGRPDPAMSIGRPAHVESLFLDMQDHAQFRTPPHPELAFP